MTDSIPDFYKRALYHVFSGVIDIKYPSVRGSQNNVFFIKTNEGEYAAKFIARDMAIKNCAAARLLSAHGVPVPETHIAEFGGRYLEYYPLIPEKTLHERILAGMPATRIVHAYEDILTQFSTMDNIPVSQFKTDSKSRQFHDMAYENIKSTNGGVMASIVRPLAYLANRGRAQNTGLYHSDITPKNVVVDENGHLVSFLDLDNVTLCNRNYAFAVMADKWDTMGFDARKLCDRYEQISDRPLNRGRINAILKGVHFFKHTMYNISKLRSK